MPSTMKGDSQKSEIQILKLLMKRKLIPREISTLSGLDMLETQNLVKSLLERGLIAKMSDGFSSFLYITHSGSLLIDGL